MAIVEAVRAVGIEHYILRTDFGQFFNPVTTEWMRMMIASMLRCGLYEKELEAMK